MIKKLSFVILLLAVLLLNGQDIYDEYDEDDSNEDVEDSFIFIAATIVIAAPIFGPIALLDDDYSETLYYQKYPFEKDHIFMNESGRKCMTNFTLSTQYVEKDILGYQLKSSFRFLRLSIEPSYLFYSHSDKNKIISDFNTILLFTFAQNDFLNFRTGPGYYHSETKTKIDGLNWKYEICAFSKPVHLNLGYKLTAYNLKKGERVKYNNSFNIMGGYLYKRMELDLGYNWTEIGERKLKGSEFRMTFWF